MNQEVIVDGIWRVRRSEKHNQSSGWPKIAILHSFYRNDLPSGENETVLRQFGWLAEAGVDVTLVSVATDELGLSPSYVLRTAANVAVGGGLSPKSVLEGLNPDVVHIHNLFPNISSRWIPMSRWAVTATLHNYRPLCAAATLSRNGKDCQLCIVRGPIHGLIHRCYRDSALATAPLTARAVGGVDRRQILDAADVLLAPSEVVRAAYASAGVDSVQILLQPTSERRADQTQRSLERYLFIGRLTQDKGIIELLAVWPPGLRLIVIGQGPLESTARELARNRDLDVDFLGRISAERLTTELQTASALIFPSTWREGGPAVYAEALSAGLPLISVDGNAVADFINRDKTGVVIAELVEDGLLRAMRCIANAGADLNSRCREIYARDYTKQVWLANLRGIYLQAIARRGVKEY